MYQERIRRTTPKLNPNNHPKFHIRLSDFPFDDRARYVESVCRVLVESRFGPGRVDPVIIDLSDRPERESAVFYDLCDDVESVPDYALSPRGRAGFQVVEAAVRRAKQMGFMTTGVSGNNLTANTSSNQGRGSP